MTASVLAALFALTAALAWGSGDFTGGLNARRVGALKALLLSYFFGLSGLTIVALARAEPLPSDSDLIWGAVAGLLGMAGFLFMLRGFAAGRMSIVAPVSAVLAAGVPVVFTALSAGLPAPLKLLGFGLAFASIWLLSGQYGDEQRPAGVGLAILAGLGFGAFFTALDQIGDGAVFWPLVAGRLAAVVLMAGYALSTRRPLIPQGAQWGLLALAGVLDVTGNYFFLLAVQTGRLDIASVLVSLYPAVTVLLAMLIAKEHMTRLQAGGVALAVLAIALITA
jgi:drug/metabolite transporter (DMT)-like permease